MEFEDNHILCLQCLGEHDKSQCLLGKSLATTANATQPSQFQSDPVPAPVPGSSSHEDPVPIQPTPAFASHRPDED